MSREVAILQSSDLSMGGVMMVEIPENEDKLTALILRTNSGVCEDGPCVGEKLREVTTVEKDGQIAVLL